MTARTFSKFEDTPQLAARSFIIFFLCLDTKKQKSRAGKKLGFIKSIPTAKNL